MASDLGVRLSVVFCRLACPDWCGEPCCVLRANMGEGEAPCEIVADPCPPDDVHPDDCGAGEVLCHPDWVADVYVIEN